MWGKGKDSVRKRGIKRGREKVSSSCTGKDVTFQAELARTGWMAAWRDGMEHEGEEETEGLISGDGVKSTLIVP